MPRTSRKSAILDPPHLVASGTPQRAPLEVMETSSVDPPQQESRMNQIARRAHEIYEARGGNHGKALEDWLQAEREVDDAMEKMDG